VAGQLWPAAQSNPPCILSHPRLSIFSRVEIPPFGKGGSGGILRWIRSEFGQIPLNPPFPKGEVGVASLATRKSTVSFGRGRNTSPHLWWRVLRGGCWVVGCSLLVLAERRNQRVTRPEPKRREARVLDSPSVFDSWYRDFDEWQDCRRTRARTTVDRRESSSFRSRGGGLPVLVRRIDSRATRRGRRGSVGELPEDARYRCRSETTKSSSPR